MGIRFLAITQSFFGQSGLKILWELRRLLSIDLSWEITVLGLITIFDFLGLRWAQKWAWPHAHPYGSGVSKPNQKVDPLGGPFGYTIISKSCFRFFWRTKPPLPPLRVNGFGILLTRIKVPDNKLYLYQDQYILEKYTYLNSFNRARVEKQWIFYIYRVKN